MSSQVFDIRPSKGMTRGQSNEHLRCFSQQAFEAKVSHNFDPSREQLNFEVKPGGIVTPLDKSDPIDARIKRSMKERGVKDPNEGLDNEDPRRVNSVIDIIFQGSRDRMRKLAFGDQEIEENNGEDIPCNWHITRRPEIEEWAKDMYKFACDKFGEKNVAAFVVHLDELNPHAHCTIMPIALKKTRGAVALNIKAKKPLLLPSLIRNGYGFLLMNKKRTTRYLYIEKKWQQYRLHRSLERTNMRFDKSSLDGMTILQK